VKRCTLSYLRKLKAVYDRFPTFDVWCISSESLGMHAWNRFGRPLPTEVVVRHFEKAIRDLGLDGVEVYPRFSRCLRRPFGTDYRTIIPAAHERAHYIDEYRGGLTCWLHQIQHFVNPSPHGERTSRDWQTKELCQVANIPRRSLAFDRQRPLGSVPSQQRRSQTM
jgi:hypothetical protein